MSESGDKLQACLNYDFGDTDKVLPAEYIAACRRWFDALSESDRAVAAVARDTFEKGGDEAANKIAAVLPPAPVFPLI